ncbi:Gfo/Idh/MocA family protein [Vaginisenegalia massiliensis]|uniref:Gfo/Idh/MocA family protein n=1 Tax=Vaginisenegalia massiliensis TaxID=2058294 RepID=UPI000F540638|nr:Gfo/Idh/MocA family oxidoreductase [Vaginisenegalia massiliensis]
MKLGIMGSGKIVEEFLSIVDQIEHIEVVSLLGTPRSQEKLGKLAQTYNIEQIYTDRQAFLADDNYDTAYVAVPNHLHYEFAKAALEAGKHVICEKPFTLNLAQLEELVALSQAKGRILIEAITTLYLGNYQKIRESLADLGPVRIVSCNYSQYSSRYDAFKAGTILPAFDPEKGGGALMDLNIYNIHFVLGLFGRPKGVHYSATIQTGIDTSGILFLDYGDFKVSCIAAKDCAGPIRSSIQAENGAIEVVGATNTLPELNIQLGNKQTEKIQANQYNHRMVAEFKEFCRIIDQNDQEVAREQIAHSLLVMEILEAAQQSAQLELG